jgi:hypothetical protein
VAEAYLRLRKDRLTNVTVERQAGHFGAMPVMVVDRPGGIAGMTIGLVEGVGQERVRLVDACVDNAGSRAVGWWLHSPLPEIGHPLGLLGRWRQRDQFGGLARATKLREIIQNIERTSELQSSCPDENNDPIRERQCALGERKVNLISVDA